jgi:Flp pilus assembly secretin CpaC
MKNNNLKPKIASNKRVGSFGAGLVLIAMSFTAPSLYASERVVVEKNHSARIALKSQAGAIIVGNPQIADATVIDTTTVYIVGRGFGSSSITIVDRMGRQLYDGTIVVTAPSQGSVTLYKGKEQTLMVCNQICVAQVTTADTLGTVDQTQKSQTSSNPAPAKIDDMSIPGINLVP